MPATLIEGRGGLYWLLLWRKSTFLRNLRVPDTIRRVLKLDTSTFLGSFESVLEFIIKEASLRVVRKLR